MPNYLILTALKVISRYRMLAPEKLTTHHFDFDHKASVEVFI